MLMTFILLVLLSGIVSTKNKHPAPTYFQRKYANGSYVDRNNEIEYRKVFQKNYQFVDIGCSLVVSPSKKLLHQQKVTVFWNIVVEPSSLDWIGLYCPKEGRIEDVLDYHFITISPFWKTGQGRFEVNLLNLRSDCEFRYYHYEKALLLATSEVIQFKYGVHEPLQGHIAMTRNPGEMRVMWTSGIDTAPMVYYGLFEHALILKSHGTTKTYNASQMCEFPASSTGFRDPGYLHDALLSPLLPNKRYYFQFGSGNSFSRVYNFTTPLPAGDHTPHVVITYGDHGVIEAVSAGAHETAKRLIEEYKESNYRKILHNGDISYAMGYAYIWDQWFALVEPFSTLVPYMVAIGNHEQDHLKGGSKDPSGAGDGFHPVWGNYRSDSGGECGVPMYNRFHMPDNGNGLWWYSYDYGLVHYIVISTEHDYSPGTPQYKWLENDLKSVNRKTTPWVIIAGHRPMYTSQEQLDEIEVSVNMQRLFEDLLYTYKVDLALWSHVHSYQRTCKLYKNRCVNDGTVHIITGTAGRDLDFEFFLQKEWVKFTSEKFGFGRLTIANSTALKYEFVIDKERTVHDSYWFIK